MRTSEPSSLTEEEGEGQFCVLFGGPAAVLHITPHSSLFTLMK
jgi:hypothetical protein